MAVPYLTVDPTTGQTVAMYPDGSVVPVTTTPAPTMMAPAGETNARSQPGAASPQEQQVIPEPEPLWFVAAGTQGTDGSPRSPGATGGYDQQGTRRGYTQSAQGYGGDAFQDFTQTLPRYADGRAYQDWWQGPGDAQHGEELPAPSRYLVPPWSGSGGGGGVGGYDPRAGGGGAGGVGGAAGAAARDRYWSARSRLQAAAGRLLGGASSSYGGSSYSSQAPQQPREERMRGRYAHGLDPAQAAGLSLRPTAMLPRVFGGGFSPAEPLYNRLAALPAAQLAMLAGGYSGSPSDLANNIGQIYRGVAQGKLPSTQKLVGQLTRGKGVTAMFEGQKAGPNDYESYSNPGYVYGQEPLQMGEAASTVASLLDAALINEPLATQQKYGGTFPGSWGSFLIDKGSARALKKPAGKGAPLNRWVGRRLFR